MLSPSRHRVHANAQQIVAHVFEQSWIAHACDDAPVDLRGPRLLEQFSLDPFAVDQHGELRDRGGLWQREDVDCLQVAVDAVLEHLFHVRLGYLIGDGHAYALVLDRQRRQASVRGQQQSCGSGRLNAGEQSDRETQLASSHDLSPFPKRVVSEIAPTRRRLFPSD